MTKTITPKLDRNVESSANIVLDTTRNRNFITVPELELLTKACNKTRHPIRNQAIIQTMFWHGLRVSELCQLKSSLPTTHPVRPEVLRTLKRYLKNRDSQLRTLFINERGDQFDRSSINYLLKMLSKRAGLLFSVNPHMLRHGCGYALANMGHDTRLIQDFLGHKNIQHTVIYTRTSAKRFEEIWD